MYIRFVQRKHKKFSVMWTCNVCTKIIVFRKLIIETAAIHLYLRFITIWRNTTKINMTHFSNTYFFWIWVAYSKDWLRYWLGKCEGSFTWQAGVNIISFLNQSRLVLWSSQPPSQCRGKQRGREEWLNTQLCLLQKLWVCGAICLIPIRLIEFYSIKNRN